MKQSKSNILKIITILMATTGLTIPCYSSPIGNYPLATDPVECNPQEHLQKTGGIGIALGNFNSETGTAIVMNILTNSPAEKSGVKTGDIIVSVNGKTYSGLTFSDLVDGLRGRIGTPVKLALRRDSIEFVLEIIREPIDSPSSAFEIPQLD